jgi:hypothetical protein
MALEQVFVKQLVNRGARMGVPKLDHCPNGEKAARHIEGFLEKNSIRDSDKIL